jgi:phosphoribosylformimino-5-aminoimidazole carboxamide ribotide isomerase
MKPFEIIPAIDILDGKVVRLTQGDYDQVENYATTPEEFAKAFYKAGAKRIHLVDLNGAKEGQLVNLDVFKKIRSAVPCELELGGGIRSYDSVQQLVDIGINYLILGSLLTKHWELASEWILKHPLKFIAGVDAKDNTVAIEGWKEASQYQVSDLVLKLNSLPLESIIYTDISKDGTFKGPNLDALKEISTLSAAPIIASGGVGTIEHIRSIEKIAHLGISGCIVGKAFLSGKISLEDALAPQH